MHVFLPTAPNYCLVHITYHSISNTCLPVEHYHHGLNCYLQRRWAELCNEQTQKSFVHTAVSERAYNVIKNFDRGLSNVSSSRELGISESQVSQFVQLMHTLCDQEGKRHVRGTLFELYQAQEFIPGVHTSGKQLLTRDFLKFSGVKSAPYACVVEFVYNYLMPIPRGTGKGIADYDPHQEHSLTGDEWLTWDPTTRDLNRAGYHPGEKTAPRAPQDVRKNCAALFTLFQIRWVAGAMLSALYTIRHKAAQRAATKEKKTEAKEAEEKEAKAMEADFDVESSDQGRHKKKQKKAQEPSQENEAAQVLAEKERFDHLADFHIRHPEGVRDEQLLKIEDGDYDAVLCSILHVWSKVDQPPATVGKKANERDKFAAQYVQCSGGTVVEDKKKHAFSAKHGGHFCNVLGWNATELCRVALSVQKSKSKKNAQPNTKPKNTPGRTCKTLDWQKKAREHMAELLLGFAVQHLEVPVPSDEDEESLDEDIDSSASGLPYLKGPELDCTVHPFDMYLQDASTMNWGEQVCGGLWSKQELQLSTPLQRLQQEFGYQVQPDLTSGDASSPTRMVLITSPPFGWGMSEYDKPPEGDQQWKVILCMTCHTQTASTHTNIPITPRSKRWTTFDGCSIGVILLPCSSCTTP